MALLGHSCQTFAVLRHVLFALLGLSVYVALSLFLGALLTFPIYVALVDGGQVPFDSVLRRVVALSALLLLPIYLASTDSRDRNALGFACSPRTCARASLTGFGLGVVAVTPLLVAFLVVGIRTPTLPATQSEVVLYVGVRAAHCRNHRRSRGSLLSWRATGRVAAVACMGGGLARESHLCRGTFYRRPDSGG